MSQMKPSKVFRGDPSDDTLPYQKWFHSVKNYMKWHFTDFKDDIDKIIWIGGVMDENTGTWYDARAQYMKKYFKVDEWNPLISAMEKRFLDRQEERKALGMISKLKLKGDIESYLMDMETLNYKVCLGSTHCWTLLTDGLSKELQYCLSTATWERQNGINYVERVRIVWLAMEGYLRLQMKQSSEDNCSSLRKKDKHRQYYNEEEWRNNTPKAHGSEWKSDSNNPNKQDKTRGRTPVHTNENKALEGIALSFLRLDWVEASVVAKAWTTTHGNCAKNDLCLHPLKPKGQHPKMTMQMMSRLQQKQLGVNPTLKTWYLD